MQEQQKKKTGGRKAGTPNKINATLKEAILLAAEQVDPNGLVGYLRSQAVANPTAFLTLLGKVLPMTVVGDPSAPLQINVVRFSDDNRP